ncbi:uncharacterized protein LOC128867788 [Anastrepha ludens]|uniref:uncharacterized protein LOC128867788 n=1 Tax=Anastrepha ludens TaxID=28586 RepID=UPI0023B00C6D|nr:uncharacterized protein LOC128867788 [Anastrepha ludens]
MTIARKPTIMKDFHSTLRSRKSDRNAIELPPPSPMHHATVGVDEYVKTAYFDDLRLMGSKLAKNDIFQKKTLKRRVTLNAINTSMQSQQGPHEAPLQSEKIRPRNYDERMPIAPSDLTIDQSLGDANALCAALTYTACPLKGVSKATIPPRTSTQLTHSVPVVNKSRSKLKPKVPSEPNIRVDAGTVMTHTDEKAMQRDDANNSHSHDVVQQRQHQQQLQPLTPPMQMLQKRQTTFDKLPNTTFAVTSIETATTTSSATASHTKPEVNAIRSLRICRTKRKKLVRQSISTHATPMKAIPLIKESIEIFGTPSKILSNGVEQLKDNDSRLLADDETEDEIKVIKAPPKLVRNKSFVLRFV